MFWNSTDIFIWSYRYLIFIPEATYEHHTDQNISLIFKKYIIIFNDSMVEIIVE